MQAKDLESQNQTISIDQENFQLIKSLRSAKISKHKKPTTWLFLAQIAIYFLQHLKDIIVDTTFCTLMTQAPVP